MEINITEQQEEKILRNVFENFPEACRDMSIQCRIAKYDEFLFKFWDSEEDKEYIVRLEDARRGFREYLRQVLLEQTALDANPKNWDAWNYDAIVQCTIFGEIIYG